jgi:hypothetical protein
MSKSLIFFSPFTKHFTDKYTNPLSIHNPPHFEQLSLTFVLESGSEECRVWVFDSNCWSTHPTCTCLRGKWSSHLPQPDLISPKSLIVKNQSAASGLITRTQVCFVEIFLTSHISWQFLFPGKQTCANSVSLEKQSARCWPLWSWKHQQEGPHLSWQTLVKNCHTTLAEQLVLE